MITLNDELVEALQGEREREVQRYRLIRLAEQSKPPGRHWLIQLWRRWLRGNRRADHHTTLPTSAIKKSF
jgi:hypothetical protein